MFVDQDQQPVKGFRKGFRGLAADFSEEIYTQDTPPSPAGTPNTFTAEELEGERIRQLALIEIQRRVQSGEARTEREAELQIMAEGERAEATGVLPTWANPTAATTAPITPPTEQPSSERVPTSVESEKDDDDTLLYVGVGVAVIGLIWWLNS